MSRKMVKMKEIQLLLKQTLFASFSGNALPVNQYTWLSLNLQAGTAILFITIQWRWCVWYKLINYYSGYVAVLNESI